MRDNAATRGAAIWRMVPRRRNFLDDRVTNWLHFDRQRKHPCFLPAKIFYSSAHADIFNRIDCRWPYVLHNAIFFLLARKKPWIWARVTTQHKSTAAQAGLSHAPKTQSAFTQIALHSLVIHQDRSPSTRDIQTACDNQSLPHQRAPQQFHL